MKLLICTQTVDANDPALGFFVRWIEEFAKHCERVEVICLGVGEYNLPPNVRVHSAGKEKGTLRLVRWWRVLKYIVVLRKNYDAVFVHMNTEYILLGGILWRLWGKRVALWYTHKSVNLRLRIATSFANRVLTASKESFRLPTNKLLVMGHGIDTNFFAPDPAAARGDWWLSVGRLNKSKRHDLAMRQAAAAGKELRIAGSGLEQKNLEALAQELGARVQFLGGINQVQLRREYQTAALLVHRSETGSLDKVVLEAAACGLPVDTTDPALARLPLSVEYVREHHSLASLIPEIIHLLL